MTSITLFLLIIFLSGPLLLYIIVLLGTHHPYGEKYSRFFLYLNRKIFNHFTLKTIIIGVFTLITIYLAKVLLLWWNTKLVVDANLGLALGSIGIITRLLINGLVDVFLAPHHPYGEKDSSFFLYFNRKIFNHFTLKRIIIGVFTLITIYLAKVLLLGWDTVLVLDAFLGSSSIPSIHRFNNLSSFGNLPRYPVTASPVIPRLESETALANCPVNNIPDRYLIKYIADSRRFSNTGNVYQNFWANRNHELRIEFNRRFPTVTISRVRR